MMKRFAIIVVVALMAAPSFGQLAGYWNFDEGTGTTAADSSGKGNPGVLQTIGSDLPVWITGHDGTGKALQFNATTTSSANSNYVFVDINTADAIASLGGAFTISMWVRSDQIQDWVLRSPTGDWRRLVYTNAYDVELAADPNLSSVSGVDFFFSESTAAWQLDLGYETDAQNYTGVWYHLALTYDGNYFKKYVNGYLVLVIAAPTDTIATATSKLYIAAMGLPNEPNGSGYFAGDLDDVAIWAGSYLPASEIVKLANNTATPLTVADHAPEPPLPPASYTLEPDDTAWTLNGWKLFWDRTFNWSIDLAHNDTNTVWMATAFWFGDAAILPGERTSVWNWNKWFARNLSDYSSPGWDVTKHGVEWISPSWSGRDPNIAVFAAYITPGIAICQEDKGYQLYEPWLYSWENKDYFKTYARVAAVNAQGAQMRVKSYSYHNGPNPWDLVPSDLNYVGETLVPLDSAGDYVWQDFKFAFPKPTDGNSTTRVWVEISIAGGDANTILYIDEFNPISDQTVTFKAGDFDLDYFVDMRDLEMLADEWLFGFSNVLDPRSGGLLTNGDFTANIGSLGSGDDARVYMNPTGWIYSGTVAGNYGIQRVSKRGEMNFNWLHTLTYPAIATPLGGDVAAYLTDTEVNDPNGVLSQTASATAVSGQTYYAMGYVMTDTWNGWKDVATMNVAIDGVDKAVFTRVLSRNKWRPIYGTYTGVPADEGRSIKIKFSYSYLDPTYFGDMLVGYAYIGTSMPPEWPEKRQNLLTNGGFEDLTEVNAISPALYHSLTAADNYGGWFTSSIHPATPGWVYEVPAAYDFNNKGGMWSRGYYGSPLPTPGMHDIAIHLDNSLILGQVIGSLVNGTTYYLDSACSVHTDSYSTWPNPAPRLCVEIWRIPAGVTDGTVIYNAISGSNPNYVKVAEANVAATGNTRMPGGYNGSKWQIIGNSYTATSSDTSMYVRIRGSGGSSTYPEYAFGDVYLSTQKRKIPGGSITFNLSSGLEYDVLGPYDSYHASIMDLYAADASGDGVVNFVDYVTMANDWLQPVFTDINGI